MGIQVVNMASAAALCTQRLDPIDADHMSIVKPTSANSPSYMAFRAAYRNHMGRIGRVPEELRREIASLFRDLNRIRQGQMARRGVLDLLDQYIASPTPARWKAVQEQAIAQTERVKDLLTRIASYESNFLELDHQVILMTENARALVVEGAYSTAFEQGRELLGARSIALTRFANKDNPTAAEARRWREEYQTYVDRTKNELHRIALLIGAPI